jgi:hypothetical protein
MDIESCQKIVRTRGNIPKEERGAQKFKKLIFKFQPSKVSHQLKIRQSLAAHQAFCASQVYLSKFEPDPTTSRKVP